MVQSRASTSHWLMYSWVSTRFRSFHMLLGLSLCVPRYQFTYCQCTKLIHFQPVRKFLVKIDTTKMDVWGVVFTPPVGCSRPRSAVNDLTCNKVKRNRESRHVWGFVQRRQTTGLSVLSCRFARKLICGLSFELSWAPPGIAPLPPTGGRTRWLVPSLILPEWHWPELLFSRFLVYTV